MPAAESLQPDRVEAAEPTVDVIEDTARFADLRSEWIDVLRCSASNNPFLTWEWLHAWTMHLGSSGALQLAAVRTADHRLIGVAPLQVTRGRLPWLSQLEFLGTGWAGSDYLDLIARHGYETPCLDALEKWLRSRSDSVRFDHLPAGSLASTLCDRLAAAGWTGETTSAGVCPLVVLRGHDWDTYLGTLRPSQRTRCRRDLNTLHKKFDVRFERVDNEPDRRGALSALMGFHDDRWTPRGGSTAFQNADLRAFHHDVTARALNAGWLRLFALRLNDEIAAVTYCFSVGGRFYLYQHGFNPRFAHFSVGVVVLALTIRSAIDENTAEFDMLYGDEPYKALWANDTRPLERAHVFPPHMRGQLHRRAVDAERGMRRLARRVFPRKQCSTNVPPAGAAS